MNNKIMKVLQGLQPIKLICLLPNQLIFQITMVAF